MHILKLMMSAAAIGAVALLNSLAVAQDHDKGQDKSHMMADIVVLGDISLSGHWTRAMLPGQKVGGGFVTITNTGAADDRLVKVSSPLAGRAEIHEMSVIDDVMKMRPLSEGLVLPAGETVELKPGGYHMMFMGVEQPFKEGGMVPVVLTFEKAGDVELMLPVLHAGMDHGKMDHGAKTN
jgi:copper(I)-binding protein